MPRKCRVISKGVKLHYVTVKYLDIDLIMKEKLVLCSDIYNDSEILGFLQEFDSRAITVLEKKVIGCEERKLTIPIYKLLALVYKEMKGEGHEL